MADTTTPEKSPLNHRITNAEKDAFDIAYAKLNVAAAEEKVQISKEDFLGKLIMKFSSRLTVKDFK